RPRPCRPVARPPTAPPFAHALLAGHLHRPPAVARSDSLASENPLCALAAAQRRRLARRRTRAQRPGRRVGLAGGASDLDARSALSSPCPLCRTRRGPLGRSPALGASQSPRLFPAAGRPGDALAHSAQAG